MKRLGIRYGLLFFLAVLVLAACSRVITTDVMETLQSKGNDVDYEVWTLDQGTDKLYILAPNLKVKQVVNLASAAASIGKSIKMPHMITFDSQYRYAFIANVQSANTAVVRVADRKLVAVLETGPSTHMAGVTPDDAKLHVDVIGTGTIVEYDLDLVNERFTPGRNLVLKNDPLFSSMSSGHPGRPICHQYTADGKYVYVTLGPGMADGGLAVVNVETLSLERVYASAAPDDLMVNCGVALAPDGKHMFLNGGVPSEGHAHPGQFYVFDTQTHEPFYGPASTRGLDAHGVAVAPDGSEVWMVNRKSSNAIVIDPSTYEIKAEMGFVGQSPDITAFSPDSRYLFVTLRGPNPLSGTHAISGDTPGLAVIDVKARSLVTIVQPDANNPASDFHGAGVVVLGADKGKGKGR